MLHYFAERDRTTVSTVLTRELEAVASARAEELDDAIPGIMDALHWPARRSAGSASFATTSS